MESSTIRVSDGLCPALKNQSRKQSWPIAIGQQNCSPSTRAARVAAPCVQTRNLWRITWLFAMAIQLSPQNGEVSFKVTLPNSDLKKSQHNHFSFFLIFRTSIWMREKRTLRYASCPISCFIGKCLHE